MNLKENAAAAYRRGSVLGFTIGEIFILLCFILLLILVLKQADFVKQEDQLTALKAKLVQENLRNDMLAQSLEVWVDFTPGERLKIEELIATGDLLTVTSIASALEEMSNVELSSLIDDAILPGRSDLLKAVKTVSDGSVNQLTEAITASSDPDAFLESVGEFGGVDPFTLTRGVTIARTIQELDPRVSTETLTQNLEVGAVISEHLSIAEWDDLKKLLERVDWKPSVLSQAYNASTQLDPQSALAEEVNAALEEARQRSLTLATSLEGALGKVIDGRGGKIDKSGTISFSDTTLFPRGKSELTGEMTAFLDTLCDPWLSTLKNQGFEIKEIRIEGHASPGWKGAQNAQDEYLKNLELSQRRARVVLEYCLKKTWGQGLGTWARERSVAVGFSSSRPISENGEISFEESQRVVLSAVPDISDIMRDIETKVKR